MPPSQTVELMLESFPLDHSIDHPRSSDHPGSVFRAAVVFREFDRAAGGIWLRRPGLGTRKQFIWTGIRMILYAAPSRTKNIVGIAALDPSAKIRYPWVSSPSLFSFRLLSVMSIPEVRGPLAKPTPLTPQILKPVEKFADEMFPGTPVIPVLQPGATDAQFLNPVGIPTYGISGESPRTTRLYDRTSDEITLDEVERIAI